MFLNLIALLERNRELYCEWYGIFIKKIHLLDLQQILVAISSLFYILNNLYFRTSGAEDFQIIIKRWWEKLRGEPLTTEQGWLIPQPDRNTWGDSRDFNKVMLVSQIIGYRPRINTKSDAK